MTTIEIEQDRLEKLAALTLKHGSHADFAKGVCAMEAVSWLAGEKHSDSPECTCPVIAAFVRRFNDRLLSDEERTALLRPIVPVLVGTRSTREVVVKRGYLAADWSVRIMLPILLRALDWEAQAVAGESLPAVVDRTSALRARLVAQDVRKHADANVANAAAYAAYAADAATYAADAADAANAANAANAAYAAWNKRLSGAREEINLSAVDLIRRMCAVTK
jgi:hypothetical protein